jgi:bifunctional DNase/RNase
MAGPRTSFVVLVLAACAAGAFCSLLRPAADDAPIELRVDDLVKVHGGQVVLVLVERNGERRLPVPLPGAQAAQILAALDGRGGLVPAAVESLGGRVLDASIDDVSADGLLRGHLTLAAGSREVRVEAPLGEALALALEAGAPILVDAALLEAASITPSELRGRRARTWKSEAPPAPVLGI